MTHFYLIAACDKHASESELFQSVECLSGARQHLVAHLLLHVVKHVRDLRVDCLSEICIKNLRKSLAFYFYCKIIDSCREMAVNFLPYARILAFAVDQHSVKIE